MEFHNKWAKTPIALGKHVHVLIPWIWKCTINWGKYNCLVNPKPIGSRLKESLTAWMVWGWITTIQETPIFFWSTTLFQVNYHYLGWIAMRITTIFDLGPGVNCHIPTKLCVNYAYFEPWLKTIDNCLWWIANVTTRQCPQTWLAGKSPNSMNIFYFPILGTIIPTDFHIFLIFFRGVGIPPTSHYFTGMLHNSNPTRIPINPQYPLVIVDLPS